jgi:hypothetical protein
MKEPLTFTYTEDNGIMYPQIRISDDREADAKPLGKYGQMALNHIRENHPNRYSALLSEGELLPAMHKANEEAYKRLDTIVNQMLQADPVPSPDDTMESFRHRQMIHDTAEEIVLNEMIFVPR